MTVTIQQMIQQSTTDPLVELYELDSRVIGGGVYYFTPMTASDNTTIVSGNIMWMPLPVQLENLSYSTTDAPAKPTLTVSNINRTFLWGVISMGDLVGSKLTRWRTFSSYLNGTSTVAIQSLPKDVFYIEKKLVHNKINIQWQLTSIIDKSGASIPREVFLRSSFPGLAKYRT